jgi:propionyl-CoA carboxylase alpha chain
MTSAAAQPRPIASVLVANRGEVARRVFRTCRARGLATVAVFSDADADACHVADADRAVRIPGVTPTQTYLSITAIVDAAQRAGADAVHPGYGFLSENADFARAVIDAGLTWVGPPPDAIALMGSKIESKAVMAEAGVPVLPRLEPSAVTAADLPILVKASAGGGGRGMRVVTSLEDLPAAVEGAAREAGSAFGDATVFCEPYLATGRHIEVQIIADAHGTVWTLGERECSLQRRHQKVIEEAPSPLVERIGPAMRAALMEAARSAGEVIGYVGAGTVEFLADNDGSFSFLEMNTRLQVEHPVTENVTGVDLVGLQLDIAEGLALAGSPPPVRGWSIEARLYAEDATDGWRPQSGTIRRFHVPDVAAELAVVEGRGVRLDSGVADGSVVSVHYDPMLAKVITTAPTRAEAARLLAATLRRSDIEGLRTNRDLLVGALTHPEFLAGDIDTAFFERHDPAGLARSAAGDPTLATVAAALADAADAADAARHTAGGGAGPQGGWRNLPSLPQRRGYAGDGAEVEVAYRWGRDGMSVVAPSVEGLTVRSAAPDLVVLSVGGVVGRYAVSRSGDERDVRGPDGAVALTALPRFVDPSAQAVAGALIAPMPGLVVRVAVSVGDIVDVGEPLLWLEAMKMEHVVAATAAGTVARVAAEGQQVGPGVVVAVVEPVASADEGPDTRAGS